jgi:hypothetical protein
MKWVSLAVLAALSLHVSASSAVDIGDELLTPAAKQDSGLGALPPYREWNDPWVFAMPAESLDSGLGDLPSYSEWREPWVFAMPAQKIDSGLGELPPWGEPARAMRRAQDY